MLRRMKVLSAVSVLAIMLAACGGETNTATTTVAPTATTAAVAPIRGGDLDGVKKYLQTYGKDYLKAGADQLRADADKYYAAVQAANSDYKAAWADGATIRPLIMSMREAFSRSHTGYESVEGIVAGVPSLSAFDTILDAGSPGSEGGDNVADFTLKLPDGTELAQPGNFFHILLEPLVYGTDEAHLKLTAVDVDGNGIVEAGDGLPDANRLKGVVDGVVGYVDQTIAAIDGWQPSAADAFTAMVTMTPTMDEYFGNWKESRYVTGAGTTEVRFVAHSRLQDVTQILTSLRTIYAGVKPIIDAEDAAAAAQIDKDYADLLSFVQDLLDKENGGTRYTPDQAEVLGKQAQDQAQKITGEVTQAAAMLGIPLEA